jgi:hypothetical protein
MTQPKPKTAAYYDKALRDGFRREIDKLGTALTITQPGEAKKPIYKEIRRLKKFIARMDKMMETPRPG